MTNKHRLSNIGALAAALLLAAGALWAADALTRFNAEPNGCKVRIDGTSTIHDWTVEGGIIGGYIEAGADFGKDPAALVKASPKVEVEIPVRTLKSGKRPMDNVMYDAMKQKDNPKIKYALKEMSLKSAPAAANGPALFDTKGDLTVAGVTRPNNMVVAVEKLADGKLKFTGTNTVKMTDFGITPPAPAIALGIIKTGDEVKVSFEWVTAQAAAGAPAK